MRAATVKGVVLTRNERRRMLDSPRCVTRLLPHSPAAGRRDQRLYEAAMQTTVHLDL